MELHRAVGLLEGGVAGTLCRFGHRSEGRHLRESLSGRLAQLFELLAEGWRWHAEGRRQIQKNPGSICLQTLSGQCHLLEFVIICRNILHALRKFELRVCDVLAAQVNFCSQVANVVGSFAINLFLSKVESAQHARIRHLFLLPSLLSPSTPYRPDDDLLQRSHGGLSRNGRKKNDVVYTQTPVTKHCIVLATRVGF